MLYYNGTSSNNVPNILKAGLVPHGGTGADTYAVERLGWDQSNDADVRPPSVFVTPYLDRAYWYANMAAHENHARPAVLKVALPAEAAKRLVHDERDISSAQADFRVPMSIPAACVKGEVSPAALARLGRPVLPHKRNPLFALFGGA